MGSAGHARRRDPGAPPSPSALGLAAASAVVAASSLEYLLWTLAGRFNEWVPVLAMTVPLALGAALVAIVASRWRAAVPSLAMALVVPLVPFVRHAVGAPGWVRWIGVLVAAGLAALVGALWLRATGRRRLVHVVALAAFAACWVVHLAPGPAGRAPSRDGLPDVVLVVMDTTRADHMSLYGYGRPTTPNLDAFAQGAVVYDNAWSVAPWTPPSHATMFTGLLPAEHGVDGRPAAPFVVHAPTLAGVLVEAGYRTAGFYANPNLSAPGWGRSFDVWLPSWIAGNHSLVLAWQRLMQTPAVGWNDEVDQGTGAVLARARRWWQDNDDGARFLFLNVIDPHALYLPPPEQFSRFLPGVSWDEALAVEQQGYFDEPGIGEDARRILRGLYDGELAYMDEELGRFLGWIEERGEMEGTLFVITSDHGERLGERGLTDHTMTMDHYTLRVPLLARYDGALTPHRVARPVQLDGLPGYILHLAGLEAPLTMARRALHARPREPVVAQLQQQPHIIEWLVATNPGFDPELYAGDSVFVAADRHALTWRSLPDGSVRTMLTDMVRDGEYAVDAAPAHPEVVKRLRAIAEALPDYESPVGGEMDPRTRERLRVLGYIR